MTHATQARKGGSRAENKQRARSVRRQEGFTTAPSTTLAREDVAPIADVKTSGLKQGRIRIWKSTTTDDINLAAVTTDPIKGLTTIPEADVTTINGATASVASFESAEMQQQAVGEYLFPLIKIILSTSADSGRISITQELVGKITGMLLELRNDEMATLISSTVALQAKVMEAVEVLDLHYAIKEPLVITDTIRELPLSLEPREENDDPALSERGTAALRPVDGGRGREQKRPSRTCSDDSTTTCGPPAWGRFGKGRGRWHDEGKSKGRPSGDDVPQAPRQLRDTGRFEDITEDMSITAASAISDVCTVVLIDDDKSRTFAGRLRCETSHAVNPVVVTEDEEHVRAVDECSEVRLETEDKGQKCDWCGTRSTCLLFVPSTGRFMCNTFREGASRTCIVRHLTHYLTTRIQARWLLPTHEGRLRCVYTGVSNVFTLGVVRWNAESSFIVSRATSALLPGLTWTPLMQGGGRRGIECMLETLFDHGTKVEDTDAAARAERRVFLASEAPTTYTFEGVTAYVKHFRNLLALVSKYEYAQNAVHEHEGVTIQWARGDIGEPVAFFQLEVRGGDKLEEGNHVIIKQEVGDLHLRGWVMRCEVMHNSVVCSVTILAGLMEEELERLPTLHYVVTKEQVSISLDRMQSALNFLENDTFSGPEWHLLAEWLHPGTAPKVERDSVASIKVTNLNETQKVAVQLAMTETLTIIKGPPGTGKTHVASYIIGRWAAQGEGRILVCAASNGAASHIAIELDRVKLKGVLRYFPASKESQHWRSGVPAHLLLEASVPPSSELGRLLKLRLTVQLAHPQMQRLKKLERVHYKSELRNRRIIVCTCGAAGDALVGTLRFRYLLIDEAAQATEPDVVVPLTLGIRQCVLVGDPQQLRPLVSCPAAKQGGLEVSALERLQKAGAQCVMLDIQYRMHPSISSFPSSQFYSGQLKDGPRTSERHRTAVDFPWAVDAKTASVAPFLFWHMSTPATGGEVREQATGSYHNCAEVNAVVEVVQRLEGSGVKSREIAVITMYDAQRVRLSRALHTEGRTELLIGNVDAVQGKERPYVIVSLVRSNSTRKIGFVDDARRANVALTRAQAGLIIVGDAYTLRAHEPWRSLLEDCSQRRLLVRGSTLGSLVVFALEHTGAMVASFAAFKAQVADEERACLFPGAAHSWMTSTARGGKGTSALSIISMGCTCTPCTAENQKQVKKQGIKTGRPRGVVPRTVGAPSSSPFLVLAQVKELKVALASELSAVSDPEFGYGTKVSLTAGTEEEQGTAARGRPGVMQTSETTSSRGALAALRLFQYWWRARIVGYLTAKQTLEYWRLAHATGASAHSELIRLARDQSFKTNSLLRATYGVELIRRQEHGAECVYAIRRLTTKCCRFRLVRRMLCGYGVLACLQPGVKGGTNIGVRHMATQGDFLKQQTVARRVIGWSALYCRALLKRTPNSIFVMSFFAPGLIAEAVRQLGFRVIGIDAVDDLQAASKWFENIVPTMYPKSPSVHCVQGDADDPAIRDRAVADCADGGTVVAQFDTVSGYGAQLGLQRVVELASTRFRQGGGGLSAEDPTRAIPFLVEDVGGVGLKEDALIRCTTTTGLEVGHPTIDQHRWYGPSDFPFYTDLVLSEGDASTKGAAWLQGHSCTGVARLIQPIQPHGAPIKPSCCPGQVISLQEAGFECYDKRTLCEVLQVHPDHVASKTQLRDAVPLLQGLHAGAQLGSWAAQLRLSLPLCSYSAACRDPRLGAWVHTLLQRCEEPEVQQFLPITEAVVIILPSHLSGQVMIQGGSVQEVPSLLKVPLAARGDFLESIVLGLATLHGIKVEPSRLRFVSDLGGGSASAHPSRVVMLAEVMTGTDAKEITKVSFNDQGQFKETVTGRVSTMLIAYLGLLSRVHKFSQVQEAVSNALLCMIALSQTLHLVRAYQTLSPEWRALSKALHKGSDYAAVIVLSEEQITAVHDELQGGEGFQSPLHEGMWRHTAGARGTSGKGVITTPHSNPGAIDAPRLKSVLTEEALEMLKRAASSMANAVLPAGGAEERQRIYREACLKFGIKVKEIEAGSKVNKPGVPQPVTIRCQVALLVGHDMVVLYQRNGGNYQLMSAPQLRLNPTEGKRVEEEFLVRGICDALQPWLSSYEDVNQVWDAVARAVHSGQSESGQLVVTARDDRGLLPSRFVPGRRIEGVFRRINLPPSFTWTLKTATGDGLKQLPPVPYGSDERGALYSLTFEQARSFFSTSAADGMACAVARLFTPRPNSAPQAASAFSADIRKRKGGGRREGTSSESDLEGTDSSESEHEEVEEPARTRMLQHVKRERKQSASLFHNFGESGGDFSARQAIELYLEPTLFEQLRQGLKQVDARRITKDHARVCEGWVLRCRLDATSPCFWVEVTEARRFATFTRAYEHYGALLLPTGVEVVQERGSAGVEYEFYKLNVKGRHDTPQRWRQKSGTPGSVVCWKVRLLSHSARMPAAHMFLYKGRGASNAGLVFRLWTVRIRVLGASACNQREQQGLHKLWETSAVLRRWASQLRSLPRIRRLAQWRHGGRAQVWAADAKLLCEFFRRTCKGMYASNAQRAREQARRKQLSAQRLRQLYAKVWLRNRLIGSVKLADSCDS